MLESLIIQIASTIPPSSKRNLEGFSLDLDFALWRAKDVITSAKVSHTDDPHRLIIINATIAENVNALSEVLLALKNIWASVTYNYFEASSCEYYQEALILRFVTIMSDKQLFVSGAMMVQGKKYQELISRHEGKIGPAVDLLPLMKLMVDPRQSA